MNNEYAATFYYDERATRFRLCITILWAKLLLMWRIKVKKFRVVIHPPTTFNFGTVAVIAMGVKRG